MSRRTPLSVPESDPRSCSLGARVNALARVPFLAGLDHAALHRVDDRTAMEGFEPQEAIYLAGRPASRIYMVASGAIKLTDSAADGTEVLLAILGPGSFLGTVPALGGATYAEDAWALTAGCVLSLSEVQLEAVLDDHPGVAREALRAVGARLHRAQERIRRGAGGSARERIAATLLALVEELGVARDGWVLIDVPLAREDLASLAGCAPETVSRHLARWRRDGVVETGRRWVAVRRPEILAEDVGTSSPLITSDGRR